MAFDLATGEKRNPNPIAPSPPRRGPQPSGCIDGSAIRAAPVGNSHTDPVPGSAGATPRGGTRLEGHPGVLALERVAQTPAGDPSASWGRRQELVVRGGG